MRYLQRVNKSTAIFHGLRPEKKTGLKKWAKRRMPKKNSCQTHAYGIFNFLCIETDFIFYWQRGRRHLDRAEKKDATQGTQTRANIATECGATSANIYED